MASETSQTLDRGLRVLRVLAVLASSSVLVSTVGGYLLLRQYDGQVERIPRVFPEEQRPEPEQRDARTILVVGSDSRGDLAAGEGTQGTGEEFVTGQRSDTMILVHLYGDSDKAQLINFPRDSWVTVPTHTDPDTGELVEEHEAKLNSAFENGGPSLLIRTIEELSGLDVVGSAPKLLGAVQDHFRSDLGVMDLVSVATDFRSGCSAESMDAETLEAATETHHDALLKRELDYSVVAREEIAARVEWLLGPAGGPAGGDGTPVATP